MKVWAGRIKQVAGFVVLLAVLTFAVDWWRQPSEPAGFARETMLLQNGKPFVAAEWSQGRTGVVYFWATWCGICRHTSPQVARLHADGIPLVGVALQSGSDEEVAAYMRNQGLAFDNINDADGRLARAWQVAVTPTVVLIKDGKMVHHTTGISSYWGLRLRLAVSDWLG